MERGENMNLISQFNTCWTAKYTHVENAGDFYYKRNHGTLFIYLQCSNEDEDWKNNFDFPAKPYKRMGKTVWFAHRGFLRVWKSVEPYLTDAIMDETVKKIVIVGYSHGAALAVLCHEYAWYNRPDLRGSIESYAFGCPRVFWGIKTKKLKQRWEGFTVIRNIDDIVTHVPPFILGFSHVGKMLKIGEKGKYNAVDAHRYSNIVKELENYYDGISG